MKIEKTLNDNNNYDIELIDNKKSLLITLAGNGDLYMSISNGERLTEFADEYIFIDISKEDSDIYSIFDKLHENIVLKSKTIANNLVSNDESINWVSDEGIEEIEDSLMILKNDDCYRLVFLRNNLHKEECPRRKSSRSIDIRFSTSGSRYNEFAVDFMNLYKDLKDIDKPKIYKK